MDNLFGRVITAERDSRTCVNMVAFLVAYNTPNVNDNATKAAQLQVVIDADIKKLDAVRDQITMRLVPQISTAKARADKLKLNVDKLIARSALTTKNFLLMTLDAVPDTRSIGTTFQNLCVGWNIKTSYGEDFNFNPEHGIVAFTTDVVRQYRVIIQSTFFTRSRDVYEVLALEMRLMSNFVAVDTHDEFNNAHPREFGLFNVDRTYIFEGKGLFILIPQIRSRTVALPMEWFVESYLARNQFRVEEL